MATYIMLASFTDQGIRKVKDSPKRADAFKEMAKKCGSSRCSAARRRSRSRRMRSRQRCRWSVEDQHDMATI